MYGGGVGDGGYATFRAGKAERRKTDFLVVGEACRVMSDLLRAQQREALLGQWKGP